MSVLSAGSLSVDVLDALQALRHLEDRENIPDHVPDAAVRGQRRSQLATLAAHVREAETEWRDLYDLYRRPLSEQEELRQTVSNGGVERLLEEERRVETDSYDTVLFDVAPLTVGAPPDAGRYRRIVETVDRLGAALPADHQLVCVIDGADDGEYAAAVEQVEQELMEDTSASCRYIDEAALKEEPPAAGESRAAALLADSDIPRYDELGRLGCRAAEMVLSHDLDARLDADLIVRLYPEEYYGDLYGAGSAWREEGVEDALSARLDADVYSVTHRCDSRDWDPAAGRIFSAYSILAAEGVVDASEGQLTENAQHLANAGQDVFTDASYDGVPADRASFLGILADEVRRLEVAYDG